MVRGHQRPSPPCRVLRLIIPYGGHSLVGDIEIRIDAREVVQQHGLVVPQKAGHSGVHSNETEDVVHYGTGMGPPVDTVAHEQESIPPWSPWYDVEEPFQHIEASMDVPDNKCLFPLH